MLLYRDVGQLNGNEGAIINMHTHLFKNGAFTNDTGWINKSYRWQWIRLLFMLAPNVQPYPPGWPPLGPQPKGLPSFGWSLPALLWVLLTVSHHLGLMNLLLLIRATVPSATASACVTLGIEMNSIRWICAYVSVGYKIGIAIITHVHSNDLKGKVINLMIVFATSWMDSCTRGHWDGWPGGHSLPEAAALGLGS